MRRESTYRCLALEPYTQHMYFTYYQGGMYIVQMMDTFATSLPLLFVALSECVVISYVYGQCALPTLRHGIEPHY